MLALLLAVIPNLLVDTRGEWCHQLKSPTKHSKLMGLQSQRTATSKPSNAPLWQSWSQYLGCGGGSVKQWSKTFSQPQRDSCKPFGDSEGESGTFSSLPTVGMVSGPKEYFLNLCGGGRDRADLEVGSFITKVVVTEAVKQLCSSSSTPGADEICHKFFKVLDVVGLSWLIWLCNSAWTSGMVPLEWQAGVMVPLLKKCVLEEV